jgi:hypothetical protein
MSVAKEISIFRRLNIQQVNEPKNFSNFKYKSPKQWIQLVKEITRSGPTINKVSWKLGSILLYTLLVGLN